MEYARIDAGGHINYLPSVLLAIIIILTTGFVFCLVHLYEG